MKKFRRLFCLTVAALGCVSCSALKKEDSTEGGDTAPVVDDAATADYQDALMVVDLNGTKRNVIIHLRPDLAPKHVASFKKLANSGYYDGLAFHRAIRSFLVQTGDPKTKDDGDKVNWGTGGADTKIPAEIKGKHKRGSVAAARLSNALNPNKASSSQFYFMLRTAKSLDSDYTVFGDVTQGLDVLDSIAAQVVDTNDVPVKRVEVKSIRLLSPAARELQPAPKGVKKTVPDSQKGPVTRLIERIW